MRKQLASALALLCLAAAGCVPSFAQSNQQPSEYFASQYGQWAIPSQQANTYQWQPGTICQTGQPSGIGTFNVFAASTPVFIKDATPANSELLTPSAALVTNASCSITISPANQHYSFTVISGTAGLQEILNQISSTNTIPVPIVLDRNWYQLVTGITGTSAAAIINTVTGNSAAYLIDRTVTPNAYYSWNGTNYTPSAANGTAPTFTSAGTGAGTSASGAIVAGSTGTNGYVTLTTGTTPAASGIIFTLTWPSIANGGFQYAPSCTVTSIGTTHVYTSGTVTTTAGAPATLVLTASATAMTASVSGYKFKYSCH